MKLRVRTLSSLPNDSQIDLWRDNIWLMRLRVQSGKANLSIENDSGSDIPAGAAKQGLQLKHYDVLLAQGESKPSKQPN
jgi:hypothetical protein